MVRCYMKGNDVLPQKRFKQRKSNLAAKVIAVGCASSLLAGCIGVGFASANNNASQSENSSFGLQTTASVSDAAMTADNLSDTAASDTLAKTNSRDISQGIAEIEAQEEAERKAAEEAARAEEEARIAAAEAAKAAAEQETAEAAVVALSDVDFSVGEEAFVAEWGARIDAYLAGSPLAGHGATFAKAAWDNGVDPRWSPAISNTESSKGAVCFLPYNAWGWGQSSWSNWDDAINAHVAGLASGYGYTISYANAVKYCPPNATHWFNATLAQMQMI